MSNANNLYGVKYKVIRAYKNMYILIPMSLEKGSDIDKGFVTSSGLLHYTNSISDLKNKFVIDSIYQMDEIKLMYDYAENDNDNFVLEYFFDEIRDTVVFLDTSENEFKRTEVNLRLLGMESFDITFLMNNSLPSIVLNETALREITDAKTLNEVKLLLERYKRQINLFMKRYKDNGITRVYVENGSVACIDTVHDIEIVGEQNQNIRTSSDVSYKGLKKYLQERIYGHDEEIDTIAQKLYMNYTAEEDEDIESIMIVGPTGVGKTETAHTACKYLDIPFLSVNAANLNPEGYKGTSIEDALLTLYELANRDIYTAQRGLLFLDEFDKLNASDLDLKSSVKNILLTFTEGGTFRIEDGLFSNFSFNTKMLNKIYAGVFEKIALTQPQMGFQTESVKKSIALDPKIVSKRLIDKGYFTAEELTRISSIIVFDELDTETKKRILTSSKISTLLKRKKRYERQFGLELYFDDSFIDAVLDLCSDKDGMRNVNIQIKEIMDDAEKAILDNEDNIRGKRLSLTKNTVLNPKNFNIS